MSERIVVDAGVVMAGAEVPGAAAGEHRGRDEEVG